MPAADVTITANYTNSPDINDDGVVNFGDYNILAAHYGETQADAGWLPEVDLDLSGGIGLGDLYILCEHWLDGANSVNEGLVAYYKLDGTSGPVVDETGNNNGVNYEAARGVTGKVGSAFDFDGINDYVSIPYSSDFAYTIGQDDITVSAWVYPFDKDNPDHGAIYSDRAAGNDVAALVMAINQGYFYLGGWSPTATDYSVPQVLVPSNNQWYLMTAVFNSTEAKLYINGDLESSTSLTGVSLANGGTGMLLGKAQGGYWENYFDGKIDEVKIWNRALSASEVKSLFQNP